MKKKKTSKMTMLGSKKQRFEVLLEDMHSNIKVIAEQSTAHTERLDGIEKKQEEHDKRFDILEIKLSQTVSNDEFLSLQKRLSRLENKVGANL